MPSIYQLIKIAGFGGMFTGASGYFFRHMYYERIRETKTYKKALKILYAHEKTVAHLGEPIKEGRIEIGELENNIRKFSVNLRGSNTSGKLNCEVLIADPEKQPEISKLEIRFSNIPNKIFVIQEA
ncbi:uncharacterized protein LOC143187220 [Calliopsis andreniformis]|uniref:uncharacterized protein LOC143187220 n=1 Tax=Calliopsis andreniformis TaxID=337506 RepID=UPI003FCED145